MQAKEDNLLDLAANASLPSDRIRLRLRELGRERESVQEQLATATIDLHTGRSHIDTFLDLLTNVRALYVASSDEVRRELNQAFLNNLYVANDDAVGDDIKQPLRELLAAQRGWMASQAGLGRTATAASAQAEFVRHSGLQQEETAQKGGLLKSKLTGGLTQAILAGIEDDGDSCKTFMVDAGGLKPNTWQWLERLGSAWEQAKLGIEYEPEGAIEDEPSVVANPRRRARPPLTESQVDAIRTARANGESVVSICRRFDVHRMTVWTYTRDLI